MAKPLWRDILETVLYALGIALLLRTFVVQAFWIPSGSMIPTLEPGDRVMVLKAWEFIPGTTYKRGDIIVFRFPVDPKRDFVKRLIGLPGERVQIVDGRVFIDSREIAEPYVRFPDNFNMDEILVPPGQLFCLGDNRGNSQDSRFWGFVPAKFVHGPVIFRYWPLTRLGRIE